VKDADSKAEVNNPPPNAKIQANEKQDFDMPLFAMCGMFRGKSVDIASAQNRELSELARKLAAETAEPVKKSFTRALQKAS
jgi:hypothetical protein